ncbi:MAG: NADH-ubiquinone oxidoreductase-F iron-sulfur binding region domain-containing protein, partial [Sulfitobacter sp.]|nr:NADH-ubiquinone oxidoreductase-F iron-sulfur binding region domain-containing protein [Sulfitobacter sp.]
HVYGSSSFFHLLADPDTHVRVCTGLSCKIMGAQDLLDHAQAAGLPAKACSCLAACDAAPAVLRDRRVLPAVSLADVDRAKGDWKALHSSHAPGHGEELAWRGHAGPAASPQTPLSIDLLGEPDFSGDAWQQAQTMGPDRLIEAIQTSGLQGRGGAGFPAHIKWSAVRGESNPTRHVVLNADEGEPGTFKDREVLLRRPDRVLEGLAIAADAIGATDIWLYLRGEFELPWRAVEMALDSFNEQGRFAHLKFHLHAGQGAYICGEETALLEALEGKRGMPRLKPPFPTQFGLWGKPTLIHNVETIACVPSIVQNGGDWFRDLGREEAGTKLYCISGHVQKPGTFELPLGATLDELIEAAGGMVGTLKAFSPGGASSGFLPADQSSLPLDYGSLAKAESMLGSAGVVVLNDTVNLRDAALEQLRFFAIESCGQCAPCRIGTRFLQEAVERRIAQGLGGDALEQVADVAWQMNEGSICGLGQAAPLPLTSALKHFPQDFEA